MNILEGSVVMTTVASGILLVQIIILVILIKCNKIMQSLFSHRITKQFVVFKMNPANMLDIS